ncbi:Leucine-rich repeat-containing protein 15 [Trichoplax sp. H2]|nr:Leucine-rich repeat-containing protein 15 [Trichoplax sp. H2]|eukprot:RDD38119.1 Leucine-rich repeat-containing protein 15 [Trichoplax sp. H2]
MQCLWIFLCIIAYSQCPSMCLCKINSVTCSYANQIPKPKKPMPTVHNLTARFTEIANISKDDFINYPSLLHLNLQNNKIDNIEIGAFNRVTSLISINLSNNRLTVLKSERFESLSRLVNFDLRFNYLTSITEANLDLLSLKRLHLLANNISIFNSRDFKGIPNLEHLDLQHQQHAMSAISYDELKSLTKLTQLKLGYNAIKTLGNGELMLPALKSLRIENNKLKFIYQHDLDGMPNLEILQLSANRINSLPDSIFSNLVKLEVMDLSNNQLQHISHLHFKKSNKLQQLYLSTNNIHTIDNYSFRNLNKLKRFYYLLQSFEHERDKNHYQSNIDWIEFPGISNIKDNAFITLQSLTSLRISNNMLTTLRKNTFTGLRQLQFLALQDNYLQCVSSSVFRQLPQLLIVGTNFTSICCMLQANTTCYSVGKAICPRNINSSSCNVTILPAPSIRCPYSTTIPYTTHPSTSSNGSAISMVPIFHQLKLVLALRTIEDIINNNLMQYL